MTQTFEIDYDGEVPDVSTEGSDLEHLFGDPEEYLFLQLEDEGDRSLFVSDAEGVITELSCVEKEQFGSTGTAAWRLEENEYGIEALVNPSAEEARRGESPEMYMEDPVEKSPLNEMLEGDTELEDMRDPLGAWLNSRNGIDGSLSAEYGDTYVSSGEKV